MSPVHMDELPAAVQAKILQQITVDDSLSPTLAADMNQVADAVIQGVNDFAKVLPQIVTLKEYFDTAERDSANRLRVPIKSCRTWTEFCRTHLGENIRTIQRLLRDVNKKPKLESSETDESAPESTVQPFTPEEQTHDDVAEHICKLFLAKSIACHNVTWAPWTPRTDVDIKTYGTEPNNDRYRVTLHISKKEAELLTENLLPAAEQKSQEYECEDTVI
jgi:hypothetical protein